MTNPELPDDEALVTRSPVPSLEPLGSKSLRERVVEAIRDAIIEGTLRPGDKIPETDLATSLGVSRTPIREAIRVLEHERLVETRPKRGTYIRKVDVDEVRNGSSVRMVLEELAVRQAIETSDESVWHNLSTRLMTIVDDMGQAVDREDVVAAVELDIAFHTALIEGAQNSYLADAWRIVGVPLLIWSPEREMYGSQLTDWALVFKKRHADLLDAILTGDSDIAARAVRTHVEEKLFDLDINISPGEFPH